MRKRITILILLLFIFMSTSGCAVKDKANPTGFAYILEQAGRETYDRQVKAAPAPEKPGKQGQTSGYTSQPGKTAYLTFDDGPDSINTPIILDILNRYGVKATFFVVGTNIEKNPEGLREIVRRGHALGNHTYNHRDTGVYSGVYGFIKNVKVNEELIFRVAGLSPRIVRDPGGELRNSQALKHVLTQNGYRLVDWNVDSYDSRKPSSDGAIIIENLRQQAKKQYLWPGMVILMHDSNGHLNTARALPTVIEMLLAKGFRFEVLK